MAQDDQRARYEYIADQINREDNLVNYRLTWILQLNGFLFAALAFLATNIDPSMKVFFLYALPGTGLSVSLAGLAGVLAANIQLRYLTKLWKSAPDNRWPRPFGAPPAFWLGTLPSVVPVVVLCVVWLMLFIHNLNLMAGGGGG